MGENVGFRQERTMKLGELSSWPPLHCHRPLIMELSTTQSPARPRLSNLYEQAPLLAKWSFRPEEYCLRHEYR